MKILYYLIGVFFISKALAVPNNHLDQISLNDGLSQSEVRAILQDSQGYMWFGTQDGLNRYDGFHIKQFHNDPFDKNTLPSDEITYLYEDSRQQLWIGTTHGICVYDRLHNSFTQYTYLFGQGKPSWSYTVTSIVEDRWRAIWVGTKNGLWRLIPQEKQDTPYVATLYTIGQGLNYDLVNSIYKDNLENIWVATPTGLNRILISPHTSSQQHISFENASTFNSTLYKKLQFPIQRITGTSDYILLSSDNHLLTISLKDFSVKTLCWQPCDSELTITALRIDRFGIIWIGTFGAGLFRYQKLVDDQLMLLEHIQEERFQPNGLKSGTIYALYEGHDTNEDIVWIGTREAGVHSYSRSKNSFYQWSNVLSDDKRAMESSIFSICTDSFGYVWVGTLQGLFQIERKTQKHKKLLLDRTSSDNNYYSTIKEDSRKNLWVGSNNGLYLYDRSHDHFEKVRLPSTKNNTQPLVKDIFEDKHGDIWIATYEYLVKLDKELGCKDLKRDLRHNTDTLSLSGISVITEDASGNFWFGTNHGLIKWNPSSGTFLHLTNHPENPGSLIGNMVLDIYQDTGHNLWICSSKGLSRLVETDSTTHFIHYTRKHGLPNSFVYGALGDKQGRIWVSTNAGLSCFDPVTDSFKNYDTNDGLTSREFNSGAFHRSQDGELFFGGHGVMVSFYPDQLVENKHLPKVNISSFQLFQQEINLDSILHTKGLLTVHYKDFVSFFFSATDYNNPSKNLFAYKLEGLQDEWMYSENRFLGIADIKPGHYTLKVKSSNSQGYWNEKDILSIPIYVVPPFWLSSGFYVLVALTTIALIFIIYRYRVRLKVERALAVQQIKIEENERVRKLAAQDLHDEFGNGLTRIAVLTELTRNNLNRDISEAHYLLEKINDNAQRLYQGTKDFIWTINPENDNFYEIALRLKDFGDDIFEKTPTEFDITGLSDHFQQISFPMGMSRHLILIFKEAMSNTLKYAGATKTLLSFNSTPDWISVCWKDNGKGFDLQMSNHSNGLINMQTRAHKIGGSIEIISEIYMGTEIRFSVKSPKMGDFGNPVF
ncbi:sensor histidine kinase [Xanthocytophaga flava]|uniref:sensor histidine kinase n=1 Tax=Xanthocytophaga flava TaxID=3048013 RepID=UPI0028D2C120|nr:two-component regulator propeller domain-containing protein [Xanthocytophaga flavus]MDJ1468371.1 two-component regulator propeller domain-containing protein [Xanthocytophaga flavus]